MDRESIYLIKIAGAKSRETNLYNFNNLSRYVSTWFGLCRLGKPSSGRLACYSSQKKKELYVFNILIFDR